MRRRTYLTSVTVTTLGLSVAGCVGSDGEPGDDDGEPGDDDRTDDEPSVPDSTDDGHEEPDDDGDDELDDVDEEPDDDEPDDEADLLGTFDDFENLGAWDAVVGTLEADSGLAFAGTQSARLTATESEEQSRIRRVLSDPIDVTDVVPGLALSTTDVANVVIQLHDADGDFLQFQQHVRGSAPFFRQNFGHTGVSGEPDPTEITEIHVLDWTGGREGELWIDDLHFVPRLTTGRVMIQFQGGFETNYTRAFPVLEAHDLTASTAIATDRMREHDAASGDRLTEAQLAELVDAGWSVGTVGANHRQLHRVDSDEVASHVLDPLDWFDERGYDARYFAFPGGRYDERTYELVAEHYDLGYAGRFRSQGWASNPYTITRISGDVGQRNLDAEAMIDAVDWTAAHGGITTIVFYQLDDADVAALEELAAHLAPLVATGDLELLSPGELADEYVY